MRKKDLFPVEALSHLPQRIPLFFHTVSPYGFCFF